MTTSSCNNGIRGEFPHWTEDGECLTIDSAVCGYCAYQNWRFSASDHVEKLRPNFNLDPLLALFLVTIFNREQYRYNYGRKCSQTRLRRSSIWLPIQRDGGPDYCFIRQYMRERKYSSNLTGINAYESRNEGRDLENLARPPARAGDAGPDPGHAGEYRARHHAGAAETRVGLRAGVEDQAPTEPCLTGSVASIRYKPPRRPIPCTADRFGGVMGRTYRRYVP